MMKRTFLALLFFTLPLTTEAASTKVSRDEFKGDWPLTIDSGTLTCERFLNFKSVKLVTLSSGGKTYALNGIASGQAKKRGFLDIYTIWRDHPKLPGLKVNIGPLIERALALCE